MFEEITEYYTLAGLLDEIEAEISSGDYDDLIERLGLNGTLYVTESYHLKEHPMYGSSRLGVYKHDSLTLKWFHYKGIFDQEEATLSDITYLDSGTTVTDTVYFRRCRGQRYFELTNHLGNVLAVVTDRKLPVDSSTNGRIDYYLADVVRATDFYPFGMIMPGRSFADTTYRFGFNGMEKDDEVKGSGNSYDFKFRVYDSRIGKFLSGDPLYRSFPWATPYGYAENDVIRSIDLEGLEKVVIIGGADLFSEERLSGSGLSKTAIGIRNALQNFYKAQDMNPAKVKAINYDYLDNWSLHVTGNLMGDDRGIIDEAYVEYFSFIAEDYNPDEKIIIYGYSKGGERALEWIRANPDIKVDLLILVDAADGWESDEVNREIPANVLQVANFYQTKEGVVWKGQLPSRGDEITIKSPATGVVLNWDLTGQSFYNTAEGKRDKVNHSNIDEATRLLSTLLIVTEVAEGATRNSDQGE